MLITLSPAKSLNPNPKIPNIKTTNPSFLKDSKKLAKILQKLSVKDLEKLMGISPKLAELNYQRFQDFTKTSNNKNAKPALFLFDGDVYKSMTIKTYNQKDLSFAQEHLRILSGLYGILKPLDLMNEYRLEMGTNVKDLIDKNLPEFWQDKIADLFNKELKTQKEQTLINLASSEYSAVINTKKINGRIINIVFKQKSDKDYKTIGILAKKGRGLMADFIIKNKIEKSEDLKEFNLSNYQFRKEFSDQNNWAFYN